MVVEFGINAIPFEVRVTPGKVGEIGGTSPGIVTISQQLKVISDGM
jgi:hypothetical protein